MHVRSFIKRIISLVLFSLLLCSIFRFQNVFASPDSETLRPNASGDLTQLLPKASPNWGQVDEAVADSDTSYVENTETGVSGTYEADLYNLPDSAIPTGSTINSITIYSTSKKIQVGTAIVTSARPNLKTNGVLSNGLALAQTTSYVEKSQIYTGNPVTYAAWTITEINALQIGVSLQWQYVGDTRYSYARCTQVYIVIDYTVSKVWNNVSTWTVSLAAKTWTSVTSFNFNLLTRQYVTVASWLFGFETSVWKPVSTWQIHLLGLMWNDVTIWILETSIEDYLIIAAILTIAFSMAFTLIVMDKRRKKV